MPRVIPFLTHISSRKEIQYIAQSFGGAAQSVRPCLPEFFRTAVAVGDTDRCEQCTGGGGQYVVLAVADHYRGFGGDVFPAQKIGKEFGFVGPLAG